MRDLSLAEVRALPPLRSEYRTEAMLAFTEEGAAPELTWRLATRPFGRMVTRRLDDGDVDALVDLYGPAERLRFLVAYRGEHFVGRLTWSHEVWNDTLCLWDIRVAGHERRRGIGTALVRSLQERARGMRVRGIMLETQTANMDAIQFYLHHGFGLVGLNRSLYVDDGSRTGDVALFLFWRCHEP